MYDVIIIGAGPARNICKSIHKKGKLKNFSHISRPIKPWKSRKNTKLLWLQTRNFRKGPIPRRNKPSQKPKSWSKRWRSNKNRKHK